MSTAKKCYWIMKALPESDARASFWAFLFSYFCLGISCKIIFENQPWFQKMSEDAGAHSKLPQPSQEEETLMCLLQHCIGKNAFFQVTRKVTHYFLIYKKISELIFPHPLLTDSPLCELCDLTVVLDYMWTCINSSHSQKKNWFRFSHQNELKQ